MAIASPDCEATYRLLAFSASPIAVVLALAPMSAALIELRDVGTSMP